ncbi:prolyl oligopeptidase family serine peptidase [Actinocrispum sp. NPDC049592]|uniref:alpha/beta hydrolase family protein n=1 Tax=Actinocrispum sp. NPDC049592 TaxID=3154835 RepID=UPI00342B6FD4
MTISGIAAGVPYVALPPEGDRPAPLIAVWHLLDSPRSEAAMAAAVPMNGVRAWRVYFGLPMTGRRSLPGGPPELFELAGQDYVLKLAKPMVDQAVSEFPAALAELRSSLSISDGPVGVAGGSMGGLVAYTVAATAPVPIAAAAMINPVTRLAAVAEAAIQEFTGSPYAWTEESRAAADEYDFVRRAGEIKAPALLVLGSADEASILEPARATGIERVEISGMGHGFADEPGLEPAPQNADAVRVDAELTRWFQRHL